ncbi:hypothetical protein SBOR_7513 [Sclerotinia borealis F-4128]|uniref:2EXR domain-containing protein n=1 Tax=Sclerotinia borealis (strain F-4128) TaxID=1432307 RepID=W9C8H1_SCLBF|nr:hypothetical protein SBOR_7513 [Sclerotinia borealis F-4128]
MQNISSDEMSSRFSTILAEMRRKIWEESLPPPRRIYMVDFGIFNGKCQWVAKEYSGKSSHDTLTPSILWLCHESRDYFIREAGYTIFGLNIDTPIYLNHSKDKLWFWNSSLLVHYLYTAQPLRSDASAGREARPIDERAGGGKIERIGITCANLYKQAQGSSYMDDGIEEVLDAISLAARNFVGLKEVTLEIAEEDFENQKSQLEKAFTAYFSEPENQLRGRPALRLTCIMNEPGIHSYKSVSDSGHTPYDPIPVPHLARR